MRYTPFAYGRFDCGLFAAAVIRILTDTDLAASFRGKYADEASAYALVRRVCGQASMEALAQAQFSACGFGEIPSAFAWPGDVVQLGAGSTSHLAVMGFGAKILAPSDRGLTEVDRKSAVRAWRIE